MKKTWPWEIEKRQTDASFTDTLITTILNRAQGSTASPSATAALEMAAGTIARAFMQAELTPDLLNPPTLGMIGRELIRRGEYIGVINVVNGTITLTPSAYTTITGGSDPLTWRYQVNLAGPSGMTKRTVGAQEVVHIRYSQDADRPWRGIGPLQAASLAGRLSAETLKALGDEASGPRGSFMPYPQKDGQDETLKLLRSDVKSADGTMLFVESMIDQFQAAGGRVGQDWTQKRFGMDPPDSAIKLHDTVSREIVSACGVSPILFDPTSSAAAREAWRQLLFGTLAPLGRLVQYELSMKLIPVEIAWQELRASDLQARARSVDSLVKAGVGKDEALRMAGLV